jgi:hypothetical protein
MFSVYTEQLFIMLGATSIHFSYHYAVLQEEWHSFDAPSTKTKVLVTVAGTLTVKITLHIHFHKGKMCGKVLL